MSASASSLTISQYTDMMLVMAADHVAAAVGGDALFLLAIPVLWLIGVVLLIAFKFRSR